MTPAQADRAFGLPPGTVAGWQVAGRLPEGETVDEDAVLVAMARRPVVGTGRDDTPARVRPTPPRRDPVTPVARPGRERPCTGCGTPTRRGTCWFCVTGRPRPPRRPAGPAV